MYKIKLDKVVFIGKNYQPPVENAALWLLICNLRIVFI
jgi:hypothetical protein